MEGGLAFTFPPGVEFEYSNVGYGALWRVVSNVAGEPLRAFADERVLRPPRHVVHDLGRRAHRRGSRREGLPAEDDAWVPEAPLPTGPRRDGRTGDHGSRTTRATACAAPVRLASPRRSRRRPLRRSSPREMQSIWRIGPIVPWPSPTSAWDEPPERWLSDGYGYGLTSGVHSLYGRVVAHSGGLPGFGSHVRWLPDRGVGVMVFANRTYGPALGGGVRRDPCARRHGRTRAARAAACAGAPPRATPGSRSTSGGTTP
jgi:CubicO group peptidase (beta-lactamase class C family)